MDGQPTRFDYREIDHCCQNFALADGWLDEKQNQRHRKIGNGKARLMRSHDIVNVVTSHLETNKTIFLHPQGVDEECDYAWASLTL